MTTPLSISIYSALLAFCGAPLAFVLWRPERIRMIAAGYAVGFLAVSAYQVGLFRTSAAAAIRPSDLRNAGVSQSQCAEILVLLENARVILDRRTPPRIVVARERWLQLPEEARQATISCVEQGWPQGAGPAQVEISTQ